MLDPKFEVGLLVKTTPFPLEYILPIVVLSAIPVPVTDQPTATSDVPEDAIETSGDPEDKVQSVFVTSVLPTSISEEKSVYL